MGMPRGKPVKWRFFPRDENMGSTIAEKILSSHSGRPANASDVVVATIPRTVEDGAWRPASKAGEEM
jgi:hypothetical protein